MKRIALPLVGLAIFSTAVVTVVHAPHGHTNTPSRVVAASASTPVVLAGDDLRELRDVRRASRSRRIPTPSPSPTHVRIVVPQHIVVVPPPQPSPSPRPQPALVRQSVDGCTDSNWRSTLGADETWIDEHESGVNPQSVNSSSGAFGLGQLLPSTYRDMGMQMSSDPCDEIVAQRRYMSGRYGSWSNARGFWESHNWW